MKSSPDELVTPTLVSEERADSVILRVMVNVISGTGDRSENASPVSRPFHLETWRPPSNWMGW